MGENSKIEWTDATVNFWWGCTKVGPGCDHCYAETWSNRTGGKLWGVGVPRRKIKSAIATIHRLDNGYADWAADRECAVGNAKAFGLPVPAIGIRQKVFIQSMSDLFDIEVPIEWFAEAWSCIETCNRLAIQILTKRISVVEKRLAAIGRTTWPQHAGLMITVVNQDEADRDIPRLLALKAKLGIPWVGLSVEPMLGPVDLFKVPGAIRCCGTHTCATTAEPHELAEVYSEIDWVISGGESGPGARPFDLQWARDLIAQCHVAGTPVFMKQVGSRPVLLGYAESVMPMKNRKGGDISEWPEDIRVREFPS
jgi:protein gp37